MTKTSNGSKTTETTKTIKSYDDVPYPSYPYPDTHPNKLASTAILFGMTPAPVDNCRVLELGCGSGNNMIAMASELPNSKFVGIDLSKNEVAIANKKIKALGLSNVEIKHKSITDITPDFGKFDYIIAHGVYSWVPDEVREKILCICRDNLNKDGVAFISYNTYPGWHMYDMLRKIMQYHIKDETDPVIATKKARDFIKFLAEVTDQKTPSGQFIRSALERTKDLPDSYFYHDQLAGINQPFYFYEFAEALEKHDLKYVRECDIQITTSRNFDAKTAEFLNNIGDDVIQIEQNMDFILERQFRETIICHSKTPVQRLVTIDNIKDLYFNSSLMPKNPKPNLANDTNETFESKRCPEINVSNSLYKAIWIFMCAISPKPLKSPEIMEGAMQVLKNEGLVLAKNLTNDDIHNIILENLLWGISMGFIQTYTIPTNIVLRISDKPIVSRLVRYDAENGTRVTNELHENIEIDNLAHHILPLLDGTNNLESIVNAMLLLNKNGKLRIQRNGDDITNTEELKKILTQQAKSLLVRICKRGLLIG